MNSTRKTRAILILLLLFLVLTGAVACAPSNAEPAATVPARSQQAGTVGLLLTSLQNPLHVSVESGASEMADRLGLELMVRHANNDSDRQLEQIQEMIDLGADALIIVPIDSMGVVPELERASLRGMAVITLEQRVNSSAILAHIAPENEVGGEIAASFLAERLRSQGNVVEIMGSPRNSAAQDIAAGFGRVIANYPNIRVVARESANFERRRAQQIFAQILQENEEVDAVFAHSDEMALGAIEAAEAVGRADEIIFVGFDAIPDAVSAIETGHLEATIAQQPTEMGRLAVEAVAKHLRSEPIPENISVDLALIAQ